MLKTISFALMPLLIFFGNGGQLLLSGLQINGPRRNTGILERMIVANGSAALNVDLGRLGGARGRGKESGPSSLAFELERDAFFSVIVFNDELRGPLPGSMAIIPQDSPVLPAKLRDAYGSLIVENLPFGSHYEIVIRDGKSGFVFFNVEGQEYQFDPGSDLFSIRSARILISEEFAAELGRPSEANTMVGELNIDAYMRPVEVSEVVDGEIVKNEMPALTAPMPGTVPGPDVIVGDVNGLAQFGSAAGGFVGLALGTDSCNAGTIDLNWNALPSNDHPVIPQNLYRMSGGPTNDERFEHIGQSSVKHGFTALTQNLCGFGCNGVGGSRLGSGCSDPYSASLNAGPSLGSRAWINPFTGFFPRGDSATPPNTHTSHVHTGPSHRILTEIVDLEPAQNPGATYWAEGQYVTPHEYAWCQSNPGQCNMYNNVSFRRYNVTTATAPFSFSAATPTTRAKAAITAWTGATIVELHPAPGQDGIGAVAYKVINVSPGVWRYEYAIYNQNLDRGIQSFSVPVTSDVNITNVGFHSPPQHPGWTFDGTANNAGYSNAPWANTRTSNAFTWASETFAQNPNANAIRWGTLYNFRFDSNRPPQTVSATIGFYKTGAPVTVQIQAPSPNVSTVPVSVSGRVMSQDGFGVYAARVYMTDTGGNTRWALTNAFGYFVFPGVTPGASYNMGVESKRFTFTPRAVVVNDNLTGVDFTANP